MDLDKLQTETEKLLDLLKARQPGIWFWQQMLDHQVATVSKLVEKQNQTVSTDALLHLMREIKAISGNHVVEISASTQIFDQISSIVPRLNPGKMSPDELAVADFKGVKILKDPAFAYNQYMLKYANGRVVIDYLK